jgi:predicted acetyltransferase
MVEVSLADGWSNAGARDFFLNAWPMYVHDISAFDSDFYCLDANGRWLPDIAGDWVASVTRADNLDANHAPSGEKQPYQRAHVILDRGRPVGFACVGLSPFRHMPAEADVILAEFFLIHGSRGVGIGQHVARALVARYPGRWSLSAIHDNTRAIRFWRKTLPLLGVSDLRERTIQREVSWDFVAPP